MDPAGHVALSGKNHRSCLPEPGSSWPGLPSHSSCKRVGGQNFQECTCAEGTFKNAGAAVVAERLRPQPKTATRHEALAGIIRYTLQRACLQRRREAGERGGGAGGAVTSLKPATPMSTNVLVW